MRHLLAQDLSLYGGINIWRANAMRFVGNGLQFSAAAHGVFDEVLGTGLHVTILVREACYRGLLRLRARSLHTYTINQEG